MTKFTTGLFIAVALCVSFTANAARPSFTVLQEQINQLQAQVNQLANQTRVVRDGNGVTFGNVIVWGHMSEATATYQWQGYDLMLNLGPNRINPWGGFASERLYTTADCSDEPWYYSSVFNRVSEDTLAGNTYDEVTSIRDPNGNTFKIVELANPSQTPETITVAAQSNDGLVCTRYGQPYQQSDMVQGIVEVTPAFGTDHPPPYTVVVE
jgi:hypothetical protein